MHCKEIKARKRKKRETEKKKKAIALIEKEMLIPRAEGDFFSLNPIHGWIVCDSRLE